ncbi:MAG: nuclear transport factor 2 family protein [Saprospiraceae bacterium]
MSKISEVIHTFSMAVDQRQVKAADGVLHADFRALVNQFMGSDGVTVLPKSAYLDMLKQEKIGGDQRQVKVHSINLTNNVAVARVTFTGKELVFHTFIQLVEDKKGNWLIISDMPNVEVK